MPLSPSELQRYSRHLLLPEVGSEGQERLKAGRVLLVGAGGLGSPAAMYLAAAGVGTLGIVEFDRVDESNLQRQVLYGTADVGRSKLEAAQARIGDLNPLVRFQAHHERFVAANARRLVEAYDVVIDGTDNFPARYLVNDACVMTKTPNVYGSVSRFEGQAAVFAAPGGPCYRCLHPEPPAPGLIAACGDAGVLGVLPGLIGTIQAAEAIKLIVGIGRPLVGRLLLYDALSMRIREIALPRDPACPVCGDAPTIRELTAEAGAACAPGPAVGAGSIGGGQDMTATEYQRWRTEGASHFLLDVREPFEHERERIDGGVLIPLGELAGRFDELPTDRPIVVYCHSGARSAHAAAMLRSKGFEAHNLEGGILAWAQV